MESEESAVDNKGFGDVILKIKKVHGILDKVGVDITNIKSKVRSNHQKSHSCSPASRSTNKGDDDNQRKIPILSNAPKKSHIPVPFGRLIHRQGYATSPSTDSNQVLETGSGEGDGSVEKCLNHECGKSPSTSAKVGSEHEANANSEPDLQLDDRSRSLLHPVPKPRGRNAIRRSLIPKPTQRSSSAVLLTDNSRRKFSRSPRHRSERRAGRTIEFRKGSQCCDVNNFLGFQKGPNIEILQAKTKESVYEGYISSEELSESMTEDMITPTNSPRLQKLQDPGKDCETQCYAEKSSERFTEPHMESPDTETMLKRYLDKRPPTNKSTCPTDENVTTIGRRILVARRSKIPAPNSNSSKGFSSKSMKATPPGLSKTTKGVIHKVGKSCPSTRVVPNVPKPIRGGRRSVAKTDSDETCKQLKTFEPTSVSSDSGISDAASPLSRRSANKNTNTDVEIATSVTEYEFSASEHNSISENECEKTSAELSTTQAGDTSESGSSYRLSISDQNPLSENEIQTTSADLSASEADVISEAGSSWRWMNRDAGYVVYRTSSESTFSDAAQQNDNTGKKNPINDDTIPIDERDYSDNDIHKVCGRTIENKLSGSVRNLLRSFEENGSPNKHTETNLTKTAVDRKKILRRVHQYEQKIQNNSENVPQVVPSLHSDITKMLDGYALDVCMSLERDAYNNDGDKTLIKKPDLSARVETLSTVDRVSDQKWMPEEKYQYKENSIAEVHRKHIERSHSSIHQLRSIVASLYDIKKLGILLASVKRVLGRFWKKTHRSRSVAGDVFLALFYEIFYGITTLCILLLIFFLSVSTPEKDDFLHSSEFLLNNVVTFDRIGQPECIV